jgi:Mrp family chromosome partitioning ATPase
MLGLEKSVVHQAADGWAPVYTDDTQNLAVMSIGFLLENQKDPIIWRGPKKHGFIKRVLEDTYWGDLDYLIIDTPPGTSDEHIAVVENLRAYNPDGAVLVTTPQGLALADVRREATFCRKARLPILGVVENMSGFVCPHCSECTDLFSSGGGERLATECKVPFLGRIPISPALGESLERGERFQDLSPGTQVAAAIATIVAPLLAIP